MAYSQDNRLIAIDTPLGRDVLLLQGVTGHEGISQLFSFDLDLLSEDSSISFKEIVGQKVTLTISLADGGNRYINGFVSRFAQSGGDERFTHYRAEVVPWLWFLTRTTDCRIFQRMTVPHIITKIFKDLGFSDFKLMLQGNFEPRDYCVQYRETDFNFVSRLMEEYGIFYFFEHEEDKHTLVLANSPSAHKPCPEQPDARCNFAPGALLDEDTITSWQMEQELRPGKYALTDYNFETPSTSLAVNVATTVNVGSNGKYEIYDFPGEYLKKAQGDQLVKIRMEEEEASHAIVSGASTCRAFTPGYRFDLEGHYSQDMNKCYVLTEVQHVASVGEGYSGAGADVDESYSNHFTCIPHDVPYRPTRVTPKPTVQGPQTAIVVGRAGEEIHTDKYGRVKVQFHWDREGKRDENSSCWIRVSHPWAGKGWGSVSIPRIGQEVIVDFIEGDPDQPIITGRVYNAELMPPYGLPAAGMVSGLKSNSTPGGGGYNEMSMNDTKGKEKITVHAQYDMDSTVEHDNTHTVINDETNTVKGNRTETVVKKETITVNGGREETVSTGEKITITGGRTETVTGPEEITINGAQTIKVTGKRGETVGGAEEVTITGVTTHTIGADYTRSVTGTYHADATKKIELICGGSSITLEPDKITLVSGASQIVLDASGVTVTGPMIKLN